MEWIKLVHLISSHACSQTLSLSDPDWFEFTFRKCVAGKLLSGISWPKFRCQRCVSKLSRLNESITKSLNDAPMVTRTTLALGQSQRQSDHMHKICQINNDKAPLLHEISLCGCGQANSCARLFSKSCCRLPWYALVTIRGAKLKFWVNPIWCFTRNQIPDTTSFDANLCLNL